VGGGSKADAHGDVEAALQAYARSMRAMDAAALAASYTPDGELLQPGMDALRGPAAIRKFLESFGDVKVESASMTTDALQTWGADAMQWGTYTQRVQVPGKATELRGRFVAQWSRQSNARWLLRRLLVQPWPAERP
jgi:uncharacterized protein (TIGR02246 family)